MLEAAPTGYVVYEGTLYEVTDRYPEKVGDMEELTDE